MKTKNLKPSNALPIAWRARVIDTGDGSGDGMIELPDYLLEQLGWKLDDKLDIEQSVNRDIVLQKLK
ncbi:MAG: hypothetical protein WC426_01780 [Sulfuriferula sp.]